MKLRDGGEKKCNYDGHTQVSVTSTFYLFQSFPPLKSLLPYSHVSLLSFLTFLFVSDNYFYKLS